MKSSEEVLNSLATHSRQPGYRFGGLYCLLFNERMYHVTYRRIYTREGNMTKSADNRSIDRMSIARIEKLIASLEDETYQPVPSRRVYILKKSGKKHPLGTPTFNDRLPQEVIRMTLEAIYEGSFDMNSRGFKPKRSCYTTLRQVQQTFNGARWFIEKDIKGFFGNINHGMMITILGKRIADERFLRFIRKFLNTGYVENWTFHKTYSDTPQGGIISPVLANIYLDQLNRYMRKYIQRFDRGKEQTDNPKRIKFEYGRKLAVLRLKKVRNKEEYRSIIREIKGYDKRRAAISYGVDMDKNFRRLKYVRYTNDLFCAVMGTKAEAETIKQGIKMFLQERLALKLSEGRTPITHGRKSAEFFGYEVYVRKSTQTRRNKADRLTRPYSSEIYLKVPLEAVQKKLFGYDALQIKVHNGKGQYKPKHRSYLVNDDDLGILERYNSEIRRVYNYHSLANNCHTLHKFKYIMEYSVYKTFTVKYKSTVMKICKKYKKDKVFTVYYKNSKGRTLACQFHHGGFKRRRQDYAQCYDKSPIHCFSSSTSLVVRLRACRCELRGRENVELSMCHVRKLKNLRGKEDWEKHMIARRRKTIALYRSCHKGVDGD